MFHYLDEVDTLDDVDADDDVDTERDVDTLKNRKVDDHHRGNDTEIFLQAVKISKSWKGLISTSILEMLLVLKLAEPVLVSFDPSMISQIKSLCLRSFYQLWQTHQKNTNLPRDV